MGIHYSLIPQFDKRNLYKHLNIVVFYYNVQEEHLLKNNL